ncbi:unnamed protein product [Durusdinium trenchii]|uniref:Voltage-dependent T-type calcium channel subunit alpha-1H n=2 Tax=Durusdinium trenchii TaxID=1381693 RepID=A0ABP0P5Z6_9DINO
MTQHAVPPNGEPALVSSRNFILRLVLPGLLQGKAQTFVQPMLPIFVAVDLGGSHGMVGLIASCYPIAQFLGSTPVGFVMKHLENSLAACLALAWMVTTALLSFAAQTVYVLMCIRLLGGLGATSFDISQKAYIAAEVPPGMRGRIAAQIASTQKWAVMIAALLSGVVAQHLATRSIFLVQASLSFCALLLIALHSLYLRRKSADVELQDSGAAAPQDVSLRAIVRDHWRGLLGAGLYCAMLNGFRNTWMVSLPLRGHHIGLSKMGIGASVAWYRGCDAAVTTAVAGYIMDNYGLKASAVPSMLLMSAAFSLLAIVQGPISLALVALVFGVGNGMCGGVINAFAASLTPPHARTQFLGLWKTVTSLGGICVPPIFGLVSDSSTLDMAGFCISGAALCTALWTVLMVQQVVPSRRAGPSPAQGDQVSVSLANNPSPA